MINTIGPVWDGNEVWLLVAGGATFAAFPRVVRHAVQRLLPAAAADPRRADRARPRLRVPRQAATTAQWQARWDLAIIVGSLVPALLWGVAFANIVRGVPIDANKEFTGNLFTLLNPLRAARRARDLVLLFLTHGAMFVALKTDGQIRHEARRLAERVGVVAAVLAVVFLLWTQARRPATLGLVRSPSVVAAVALLGGARGEPGRPRGLGLRRHVRHHRARGRGALPRAVPGRHADRRRPGLEPDDHQRVEHRLHAEDHDLVALIFTPIVLVYQGWTYWVFRKRIASSTSRGAPRDRPHDAAPSTRPAT